MADIFKDLTPDESLANDGVWFYFKNKYGFKLKSISKENKVWNKSVNAFMKTNRIESLDKIPEWLRKDFIKIFISCVVVDWKGVEFDGKPAKFTGDNVLMVFEKLPQVFHACMEFASEIDNYKELQDEEDLKN